MDITGTNRDVYVGLLPRGVAYFIDCTLAFGLFAGTQFLLFVPIRGALGIDEAWFHSGIYTELYTLLTISLPVWLYFAFCEQSRWQATVGKRILRLRVVKASDRSRISFPQSLLRTVIKLLPWEVVHLSNNLPEPIWYSSEPDFRIGFAVAGLLLLIYIVTTGVNRKKQGPQDMIARTVNVKRSENNA